MNQTFPHVAVGEAFIGCTIVSRSILQTFLPSRFDSMLKVVTPHEMWIFSRKKQLPGASKGVQAAEIAALRNRGGANEKECEDLTDFVGIFVLGGPTVIVSTNCTRPNSQIPRHFLIIAMLKPHFSQGGRSGCWCEMGRKEDRIWGRFVLHAKGTGSIHQKGEHVWTSYLSHAHNWIAWC